MSIHTSFVPNVTVFCLASGTLLAATPPEGTLPAAGRGSATHGLTHLEQGSKPASTSAVVGSGDHYRCTGGASLTLPIDTKPASIPIPRVPPPPSFIAHRAGRFFIVQSLKASLPGSPARWRCILATASQGYVTHRDFGPHDSDYILAVQFGREFEEEGRLSEDVAP